MYELVNIDTNSVEYQDAIELHTRIITSGSIAANALVDMCKSLKKMRDDKQYIHLGYRAFDDYVTEAARMKARQAYNYISTIESLGEAVLQSNANLGITKLQLLAQVPESKRDEVAEAAGDLSARELKEKVAELTKAREQIELLEDEKGDLIVKLADTVVQINQFANEKQLDPEVIRKEAIKQVEKEYQEKLAEEKRKAEEANRKLAQAAIDKASRYTRAEIDKAREEGIAAGRSAAEKGLEAVEREKAAALAKAQELEKKLAITGGNPDTILLSHLFTEWQEQFNKIISCINKIGTDNDEIAGKYRSAMKKFIGMMEGGFHEGICGHSSQKQTTG